MAIGLKRGFVELAEHDPEWERLAGETVERLWGIFGAAARDIQHVGSTAISGIKAKPIIDIAVAADNFGDVEALTPALELEGFFRRPWNTDEEMLFGAGDYSIPAGIVTHLIHVVKTDSPAWHNYVNFRDYLNANPAAAKAYETLKLRLAAENPLDKGREKYLAGKYGFIKQTLRDAAEWSASRKFAGTKIKYETRRANPEDLSSALDFALRAITEFETPGYAPARAEDLRKDFRQAPEKPMFIALDKNKIIGLCAEKDNGEISLLFVDGAYRRQGIGTALLSLMVCSLKLRGFDRVTLESPDRALPFFLKYGFETAEPAKNEHGRALAPMAYTPKEILDVYDSEHKKTGRHVERDRKMAEDEYFLVVHVWKHNGKGEWLIDQRSSNKGTSTDGKWETTGGSALAGEESLAAALRETREELGIDLDPRKGKLFASMIRRGNDGRKWIQDAWVFEHDCPIESLRLSEAETVDAIWASAERIREMMKSGEMLSEWFYPYFEEMTGLLK